MRTNSSGTHTGLRHKKKSRLTQEITVSDPTLLDDLGNVKRDIDTILLHLNYQTDPDLIDSYAYQLKSAYMRYKFLLRQIQKAQ